MTLIFDPLKPAAEMTGAELMAAHVVMGAPEMSGEGVATKVRDIYEGLNKKLGTDEKADQG